MVILLCSLRSLYYSCFLCKALIFRSLMMRIFKLWHHITVLVLVLNTEALFCCLSTCQFVTDKVLKSSLWGTSITGNVIWDFVWHCLLDLTSHHVEHKVVWCNPCKTQKSLSRTVTKLQKPITFQNCRFSNFYSHIINIWIINISISQCKLDLESNFLTDFICMDVCAHKMPGSGVQNVITYVETYFTWLEN